VTLFHGAQVASQAWFFGHLSDYSATQIRSITGRKSWILPFCLLVCPPQNLTRKLKSAKSQNMRER